MHVVNNHKNSVSEKDTATSESRFRRNISGIHCSSQNVFTHHHMHNFMLVFLWLPPVLINSMAGAEKGLNFRFLIALVYKLVLAFCKRERKWKGGLAYPSLTSRPPFMLLRNSNISFTVTRNVAFRTSIWNRIEGPRAKYTHVSIIRLNVPSWRILFNLKVL